MKTERIVGEIKINLDNYEFSEEDDTIIFYITVTSSKKNQIKKKLTFRFRSEFN